jgi:F0F1-type ATP synthase alpha subunit
VAQKQVASWEAQVLQFMREQKPETRAALVKERKLSPAIEQQLNEAIGVFQAQFKAS